MQSVRKQRRDVQLTLPDVLRSSRAVSKTVASATRSNACDDSETRTDAKATGHSQSVAVVRFTVPGEPVAKGRARAFIRNGKIGHHTPDKTARYENLVKLVAKQAIGNAKPLEGPLSLRCTFWLSVPMSYSSKRRKSCLSGSERHCKRPDIDNLLKSVKDGCNGVAWVDDCQVVEVSARKCYGETPGVDVEINLVCE